VLGFALFRVLLAGSGLVWFGLQSSKVEIAAAIREGARGSAPVGKTNELRGLLIVIRICAGSGVDGGSGTAVRHSGIASGRSWFHPSRVVASNIYLPHPNNPDLDRYGPISKLLNSFVRETVRRVRAIPGVDLASITTDLPVTHLSLAKSPSK